MKKNCETPTCKNHAREGRRFCCTCRDRKWREAHPIRHLWKNTRAHAKVRGKKFDLTYEQFEAFCKGTGYHETVGRAPDSSTIDRVEPSEGYRLGNIRALPHLENSTRKDAPPGPDDYPW